MTDDYEDALIRIKDARARLDEANDLMHKAGAAFKDARSVARETKREYEEVIEGELADLPLFPRPSSAPGDKAKPEAPAPVTEPKPTLDKAPTLPLTEVAVETAPAPVAEPKPQGPVALRDKAFGLGKTLADKLASHDIHTVSDLEGFLAKGAELTTLAGITNQASRWIKTLLGKFHNPVEAETAGPIGPTWVDKDDDE